MEFLFFVAMVIDSGESRKFGQNLVIEGWLILQSFFIVVTRFSPYLWSVWDIILKSKTTKKWVDLTKFQLVEKGRIQFDISKILQRIPTKNEIVCYLNQKRGHVTNERDNCFVFMSNWAVKFRETGKYSIICFTSITFESHLFVKTSNDSYLIWTLSVVI